MADREKVIAWLEICGENRDCSGTCPYSEGGFGEYGQCREKLMEDALALLKEQEAVEPHYNARTNWYECGACHYSMTSGMHCRSELIPATKVRYCANCGFPVNWEGR